MINLDYVHFGDVIRRRTGMQCQYGSRYSDTVYVHLWYLGNVSDYHSMAIHKDDVEEFVSVVLAHRLDQGIISMEEFNRYKNV